MTKVNVKVAIVFCACLALSHAREWNVASYPNPSTPEGAIACGRGKATGFVCDPDGYISSQSADVVEGHIKQIAVAEYPYGSSGCREEGAENAPGFQVAVALASSISRRPGESAESAMERFANGLFNAWGIGEGDCGNGVLLVVAFKDRQTFIATGKGISKFATDESLRGVIDNMRLRLRAEAYSEAIEQAVIDIGLVLAGADPHPGHPDQAGVDWHNVGLISAIGAFFGLVGWAAWAGNRQKKQAMTLLEKLQKEQETARLTGKYPASSCPICFEDLKPLKASQQVENAESVQPSAPPLEENLQTFKESDQAKQPLLTRRKSREKPAESSSASGAGAPSDQEASPSAEHGHAEDGRKTPLCIPCGHTFCTDCISEWLKRNQNCPVCREPVGSGEVTSDTQRQLANRDNWDRELYNQEMEYRMRRLHRRYPQYITSTAVDRVVHHSHRGDWIDFSSMRNEMMQPEIRSNYQESGHQGSSMSFGGGHSSGHGFGGSW